MRANNSPEQDSLGTRDCPDSSDFLTKNLSSRGFLVMLSAMNNMKTNVGAGHREYLTSRTLKKQVCFVLSEPCWRVSNSAEPQITDTVGSFTRDFKVAAVWDINNRHHRGVHEGDAAIRKLGYQYLLNRRLNNRVSLCVRVFNQVVFGPHLLFSHLLFYSVLGFYSGTCFNILLEDISLISACFHMPYYVSFDAHKLRWANVVGGLWKNSMALRGNE